MSPGGADRSVDQSPMVVNPMRQQRRIFIFRRHDHPVALEVLEIFRERQGHARAVAGEGGVNDGILA